MSVSMDYAMPGFMAEHHDRLRAKFEPLVEATNQLAEVQVMAALTLRLARLTKAAPLLAEAGFKEETQMLFRGALESIVNLIYIMHVGPIIEGRSSNELAKQFMAYGDVAYQKLVNIRNAESRAAFKKRLGMTDEQIDKRIAEINQKRISALANGCATDRWNKKYTFQRMAELVQKNLPPYVFKNMGEIIFSCFVTVNSAVHGDSLSLRTQYNELKNRPLEIKTANYANYADVMGSITLWAWQMIAEYYSETKWLNEFVQDNLRIELDRRIEAAKQEAARTVVLPPWIPAQ